jgi:hypothetical protein
MKKNKFWLAAMAVTVSMASCSLEEVMEQPEPQAIGFSSFVGKPTRAVTETKTNSLGSFKVYGGYVTNTDVFNGTEVTTNNQGSTWEYAVPQYWVPGQIYKFAAMGPSGIDIDTKLSFDYTSGHLTLLNYEVTDLATGSKDLVYAEANRTTDNPLVEANYAAVPFSFGHIMSWIKIKFVHDLTDKYKITVSDVSVTGVKTKGTFNGTNWTMDSSPSDATFNDQDPNKDSYNQTDKILDANGDNCLVDFIAIPQTVATLNISFKLTVQDDQGSYIVGTSDTPKEFSATTLSGVAWQKDYVYTYTATLDESVLGLKPITFTATVEDWTNKDNNTGLTIPNP